MSNFKENSWQRSNAAHEQNARTTVIANDLCIGKVCDHKVIVPCKALASSSELASTLADLLGASEAESSLFSYWSLEVRKAQWRNVLVQLTRWLAAERPV